MSRTAAPLSALIAILVTARPAAGQRRPELVASAWPAPVVHADSGRGPGNVAGAALGATLGMVAGGVVGLAAAWDLCPPDSGGLCDPSGYLGGVLAGWMGAAVGIGVGAHLGNGRRGNVIAPLAASLAVLVAGGIVGDNGRLSERSQFVIPVAQIVAAVAAEITTGRAQSRR